MLVFLFTVAYYIPFREDYDKLSQFVSEKKLRVKSMVKVSEHPRSYKDDGSSDSDHDAYLERMIAEGEDKDSEDGMICYLCVRQLFLKPGQKKI